MQPLRVSQLPFVRPEVESVAAVMERDGFVDEAVVKILVATPKNSRTTAQLSDLILSAEDLDFAGWNFPVSSVSRQPEWVSDRKLDEEYAKDSVSPLPLNFARARPDAPEPSNRWWLAGLAGVISTVGFSLILLKLISPNSFGVPQVMLEKPVTPVASQLEPPVEQRK